MQALEYGSLFFFCCCLHFAVITSQMESDTQKCQIDSKSHRSSDAKSIAILLFGGDGNGRGDGG